MFRRVRNSMGLRAPEVLVVVPCYNYGRYLDDCIASLLSQEGVNVRVHILDDASTDGSAAVAQAIEEREPRVKATLHEQNRGHINTYNEGLALADSDYVVLLSADDLLAPGALGRATSLMEAFPSVGLVYGHPQAFETAPVPGPDRPRNWSTWKGEGWITAQCRRGLSIISSPEAVVRTSVHHEVGYYRPELPHSGDLEMWLRIADVAGVGRVNGVNQAYHRVHPSSMMATGYSTLLADLEERVKAYDSFFSRSTGSSKQIRRWQMLANRRMAAEALEWAAASCGQGGVPDEAVESAAAFALRVDPQAGSSDAYLDYRRRLGRTDEPGLGAKVAAWRGAVSRDYGARLRWRRWRRYGL